MATNMKIQKLVSSVPTDLYPETSAGNVKVTPTNNIPITATDAEKIFNALDGVAFNGISGIPDATTTNSGLMSASDKTKLDGVASNATATSVSQGLSSGTEVGTITVNGSSTKLYAPETTNAYSATGTAPVSGTAVAAALATLDVNAVGGTGKYISTISEADGKISATAVDMPTSLPASNTTNTYSATGTVPVSGTAVAAAIGTLEASEVGGTGKYISAISETNGVISATATNMPTSLPASNTTNTYSATGTDPVSGTAVAAAIATLDVEAIGGSSSYITSISETNGVISATAATMPTSLPASNTVSAYSSTGTDPVNGTAVAAALATLDVNAVGGTGKYISTISETDGKISATAVDMPTSLPASDVSSWAKASTKPTYNATEVGAISSSLKGAANGVAELDSSGKVPSSQLPGFVDDILEYNSKSVFPATGEAGKLYVDTSTNLTYRWSGTSYVEVSPSIALGETSSTAYRGDRGATAYTHSQSTHARTDATNTTFTQTQTSGTEVGTITVNGTNTKIYTPTIPSSLPASNTVSTYSATGTDPVNGKAVAAALATLDVNAVGGTGKYISTISETDGKISATAVDMPTSLPASDVSSWAKASTKPTYTASEVGAATSGHTHTTSIASSSGTSQIALAANTKYSISAGGTSYIFTTPANPDYSNTYAPINHGNHVPATQTADNTKFLRNDNTWQSVTPANIGALATSADVIHYGSSSSTGYVNDTSITANAKV